MIDLPRHDRLHGRRRGRRLRLGQATLLAEALPHYRLTVEELRRLGPRGVFETAPRRVWLEIGFGGGEHLAHQAASHADTGIIGCEVFQTGIVSLLHHLDEGGIGNVRIVTDDARLVLDVLPDASLGRVFILFPDPWPKARHHKRRLVSPSTMNALARTMEEGAELRLAT
ncbi:MAG TPA: tRNA (guanine(46)-N(7))-methyltransferase TrmB, partial [Stellaceae bacterium]|nr:tRNA (guanine(46)-N(7))-methyltransferase TrmB [Stellaceae bacterium]